MDIQTIKIKLKKFENHIYIFLLFVLVLVLYIKPLFSNFPLGLDTLGHLSKISYIKEFGFSFMNSQGTTVVDVGKEPSSLSIYSKDIPILYINEEADIASGTIRLRIW